jgi:hypothetical protein
VTDPNKEPIPITVEMMESMSRVNFDIECLHDVDKKHFNFSDSEFLGIAVACCLDHEGEFKDFVTDASAFRCFGHLMKHKMIIGYNTIGFDFPLLGGSLLTPQNPYSKRYVASQFGGRIVDLAKDFSEVLGHRISLQKVSVPTLGDAKEMEGGFAPEQFRRGKILEVIEYCRGDVRRTDDLFVKAVRGEDLMAETKNGIKTFKCTPKLRWAF